MRKLSFLITLTLIVWLSSCQTSYDSHMSAFDIYCEMVANQAKPVAFHNPMDPGTVDRFWSELKQIADNRNVQIYREDSFPTSYLFPAQLTKDKTIIVIYNGNRLEQYLQLKNDLQQASTQDTTQQMALARRFGRLLGYTTQGINRLLSENSNYQNLAMFDVKAQITQLYYDNLPEAELFYDSILGLPKVDAHTYKISNDAFIRLNSLNENHPKDQAKSTAIALLTNQLSEWYSYIQEKEVPIKYTYKPRDGGPHDGFVAIDPGGYLLEFEQFKQHPENELFMAVLADVSKINTDVNGLNFYGSITWTYHKDMLKMQQFYEEVLGYQLVADQGWTKIYQTSPTGFIGLVDECRGMEDYAETKAVELEWVLEDFELFNTHAEQYWNNYKYDSGRFVGPEKYQYIVRQ